MGTSEQLASRLDQATAPPLVAPLDERAARRTLREQIARLERDLGIAATSTYPRLRIEPLGSHAGPRMLSLGELERVRDDLAAALQGTRAAVAEQAECQQANRLLLERMLLEPGHYKWLRIAAADIGEPSCKTWEARPRLGVIGMLLGWWRVKISSGCPLAWGPCPARPRNPTDGTPQPQAWRRRHAAAGRAAGD